MGEQEEVMTVDLAELRRLVAALLLPLYVDKWEPMRVNNDTTGALLMATDEGAAHEIVAAVNALPELLDEVERLRGEGKAARGLHVEYHDAKEAELATLRARVAELEGALVLARTAVGHLGYTSADTPQAICDRDAFNEAARALGEK